MPYYFLSEEAAQDMQNIVGKQIEGLEKELYLKKAMWNDLGNKVRMAGIADPAPTATPGSLNLTKADLTVPKFPRNKTQEKSYKTLFYLEMPDGRVALRYMSNLLYTSKEIISRLPYPMPNGYLKHSGLTANNITGIKLYQELLSVSSENTKKKTTKVSRPTAGLLGTNPDVPEVPDPDRGYTFTLKTDTKGNHGEDYEQLQGDLSP